MTRVREWDRPLDTVHFESPTHTATLLCGLNALRANGLLLDVTLLADGEAFQAHRVVLASCSEYFRAMFTDAMREARQSEIRLKGVSAAGIRLLLDYAYTSRLALNLDNIQSVLAAASHIQVHAVVEGCSNFLQAQLDLDNCVDIATIAETYSLSGLRGHVYRFMSAKLKDFARSVDFHRLSPQQLDHLLGCDYPVDCPESEVLRIVLRWLQTSGISFVSVCNGTNGAGSIDWASRLLHKVHFGEISRHELDSSIREFPLSLAPLTLAEACRVRPKPTTPVTPLINSRGMELAVVKVGGFGIAGITNEITYLLPSLGKWRHLTTIPHVEQCNFGTAVLDNHLYVVGGCFNQALQENIHPFGFRYSPQENKWTTMAPMQRERCRFSLTVLNGCLYACGGASEIDFDEEYSPCERYDPDTDSWETVRSLPEQRTQHAGAAAPYGNSSYHVLYISGGLDATTVLSTTLCIDPRTDRWERRANMLTPRADHVMLVLDDRLYVCGGWYENGETGNRVLADTIDCYDPAEDSWRSVTRVPTPRYHAGIVAVKNCIYFIGGFHNDALFDRATAAIEYYNTETNAWSTGDKYPQDIWEHTCVPLYIPRCRDGMEVMASPRQT